jgi:CrcB protein
MMLKNFLWVGLGGAVGSVLRYAVSLLLRTGIFPASTLLVNLIGCFLLGVITGYAVKDPITMDNWKPLLATGLCGGFTTFSAFSMESLALLQQQRTGLFILYVTGSILMGMLAVWLGMTSIK